MPSPVAVVVSIVTAPPESPLFVNPEDKKAFVPILVTELGIVIDVKAAQDWNTSSPILPTELPIVTVVKLRQLKNAPSPILVTEFGIIIDVKPQS